MRLGDVRADRDRAASTSRTSDSSRASNAATRAEHEARCAATESRPSATTSRPHWSAEPRSTCDDAKRAETRQRGGAPDQTRRQRRHEQRGDERFDDPVIITCSISGAVANRDQCPAIPYTPEEYAAEARRIVDEGGVDDPHPRAHAGRRAELRDRGLPQHHRGDPRRGRRRDHQLLDRRDRRPDREADRVPARAAARGGRAEHGLDELREVLASGARTSSSTPCSRTRSTRSSTFLDGDERARHQARARVLRLRPRREPRPAARHGPAARAAPDLVRDGRDRRHPARPRATSRTCPSRSRAAPTGRTTGA